ncbi:MAG TPA: endonuclease/exonuclease/phosphatase family protein [Bacteroidales bacterium]|nr:endonuclease/exonuclease/phosphatase family protein [Bacteroidales bacterium]
MNGFWKIVHSFILTITFGVVVLLILCGHAYLIKPEHSVLFSFLGYAFPVLALVNLFFIFYWGVRLKLWIIVPLLGFFLTLDSAKSWFPIHFNQEEVTGKTIKVLSYNVEFLTHAGKKSTENLNPIVAYIRDLNPDIVCLQEVGAGFIQKGRFDEKTREALKAYRYFATGEKEERFSVVCLSRYPILRFHRIEYESQSNSSWVYDIKIGKDTVRVINNHLESNKLNREEKDQYTEIIQKRESAKITKVAGLLGSKVGKSTQIRGNQADAVFKVIHESPYKVIVCGDFNDVPGSYTYRKIRSDILDCWVERGNGWGHTFHENLFLFRIDYILHTPDIRCVKSKVEHLRYSDHYPLWANFLLP